MLFYKFASLHRADVMVTDLPDFVPLMSENIDLNKDVLSGSVTARTLIWWVSPCKQEPIIIFMNPALQC